MTAIILEALAPIWGYLAAAVVALGGFLAMQAKARREGRKQAETKTKEKDHANADEVRDRVARVPRSGGVRPDDERGWRD